MYWKKTPSIIQKVFSQFVWRVPNEDNTIYLTFDDGPNEGVTDRLLDILKAKNIVASFFCLGENIEMHPGIFQKIKEGGHFVGNHGWSHLNGWKVSKSMFLENLNKGENLVMNNVFRPAYGKIPLSLTTRITKQQKVVMWDIMSGDFDSRISVDQCLDNVLKNVQSGSVIVFHDNQKSAKTMLAVIPLLIDKLKKESYKFGKISP